MKISINLEVPTVPNFVSVRLPGGDVAKISIAELSAEQIKQLGALWTERLQFRADEVRKETKITTR